MTATVNFAVMNLRRRRATDLAAAVMDRLGNLSTAERDLSREVYEAIVDVCTQEGVEVLTDRHRAEIGLSPRGPSGWTTEEIILMEELRREAMMRPVSQVVINRPAS